MNLHEYQAKQLFAEYGLPVSAGHAVDSGAEAIAAAQAIGEKSPPDLIINASGVPKQTIPDTSVFIQKELGFSGIPSFSIHSTCLSFLTAFHTASSLIESKQYKKILKSFG